MRFVRLATVAWLLVLAGSDAAAFETDQYYAWTRELADSTDALNAKVELELRRVLERVNGRADRKRLACHRVAEEVHDQLRPFIFRNIGLWAANSPFVARVPADDGEELAFRDAWLFRRVSQIDMARWMPPSPTVSVGGVRFGTDKLGHFVSEGWWYYTWYRRARGEGLSHTQAVEHAVRRGIKSERTVLGMTSSGVLSMADLEANHQGLRFFIGLCYGSDPYLERTPRGWRQVRRFDFRDYVNPDWDESYNPNVFVRRVWKRVQPVLREYCPLLDDPAVAEQRRAYRARDRVSLSERLVRELVERGKLRDPATYSIEANCPARAGATH